MKRFMLILGGLLSVVLGSAQAETPDPCQVAYLAALEQFERGEMQSASELFNQAIKIAPAPEAEPVEYLPYIYLSAAEFEMGHTLEARDALIQSQVFGVAAQTDTGQKLLERYAAKIMSAPLGEAAYVSRPQASPAEGALTSLSDSEVELIRTQVLRRCALSSRIAENKLPWYFHYEFGVDLLNAGDAGRAVEAFVMGANVREDPSRGKRMYGMWYIDYLPYYQIALAHSRLGDWESAFDALQTSESLGEFSPDDPDYESFSSLSHLIRSNLENSDS